MYDCMALARRQKKDLQLLDHNGRNDSRARGSGGKPLRKYGVNSDGRKVFLLNRKEKKQIVLAAAKNHKLANFGFLPKDKEQVGAVCSKR